MEDGPAFLSAHWGAPIDSSEWYDWDEFQYNAGLLRVHPFVWVGEDHHAAYESRAHCDWGGWSSDNCNGSYYIQTAEVLASANMGRRYDPLIGCIPSRVNVILYPGTECLISGGDFKGWMGTASGATSYEVSYTSFMTN